MMTTAQHVLYAGSYAAPAQAGIYAFTFDAATSVLTPRGSLAGIANPSFIALHPNGRWLYAVSETSVEQEGVPGAVWAVGCTREPWGLTAINQQASGGDWPCHLAIHSTGWWLVVSNYASGTIGVFPILADGALGAMSDLVRHTGSGPHPVRQQGPHTHSATFTPDERFVIVSDLGLDALAVYAFDPAAGRLQAHMQVATRPGAGPRHMAFHPNGERLYVANELDNTVAVYDYDATRGALQAGQILDTLPPGAPESTVADIHITPAGDRLYVSNRGYDSVAVFDVGADGQLAPVAIRPCGGQWPRNFAVAPGGRFLLVANQYSDTISTLPVVEAPDALGAPVAQTAVPGASCVQFIAAN
jgi:6-phosphogluconolactonase